MFSSFLCVQCGLVGRWGSLYSFSQFSMSINRNKNHSLNSSYFLVIIMCTKQVKKKQINWSFYWYIMLESSSVTKIFSSPSQPTPMIFFMSSQMQEEQSPIQQTKTNALLTDQTKLFRYVHIKKSTPVRWQQEVGNAIVFLYYSLTGDFGTFLPYYSLSDRYKVSRQSQTPVCNVPVSLTLITDSERLNTAKQGCTTCFATTPWSCPLMQR